MFSLVHIGGIVRLASETGCRRQSQRHDKEFFASVNAVSEAFWLSFGRKSLRLYTLVWHWHQSFHIGSLFSTIAPTHGRALTRVVRVNLSATTLAFISGPCGTQTLRRGSMNRELILLSVMSNDFVTGKQETSHAFCLVMLPILLSMDTRNCLSPFFVHTPRKQ
jgi:hypothetical protein